MKSINYLILFSFRFSEIFGKKKRLTKYKTVLTKSVTRSTRRLLEIVVIYIRKSSNNRTNEKVLFQCPSITNKHSRIPAKSMKKGNSKMENSASALSVRA